MSRASVELLSKLQLRLLCHYHKNKHLDVSDGKPKSGHLEESENINFQVENHIKGGNK